MVPRRPRVLERKLLAAVVARRHAGPAGEGSGEVSRIGVAQSGGDLRQPQLATLEQTGRGFETNLLDQSTIDDPDLGEPALEGSNVEIQAGRYVPDGRMPMHESSRDHLADRFDEIDVS